ncbi:MAG: hypothetical protein R2883_03330 [Caldisericia bacterium]
MDMLGISFSAPKMFSALKEKITNPYDALKDSSVFVVDEINQNFKSGGRPKWTGGKNLHKSGSLKNAATSVTIAGNRAEIGAGLSELPYAAVHEFGTKTIPKRSFMNMPPGWVDKVKEILQRFLIGGENDTI